MADLYEKGIEEALHYIEIGRTEQALDRLGVFLTDYPQHPEALYWLAVCLYDQGRYEEALTACLDALNYGYSEVAGNHFLGNIYVQLGRPGEAERHYLETLRFNPNNGVTLAAYGLLMQKTGFEGKAKKLMAEALKLEPDSPAVLNYHLRYYTILEKKGKQLAVLKDYLHTSSSEIDKVGKLGLMAYIKKDYKTARDCYREVFLSDPSETDTLEVLDECQRKSHPLFFLATLREKTHFRWLLASYVFIALGAGLISTSFAFLGWIILLLYLVLSNFFGILSLIYRLLIERT